MRYPSARGVEYSNLIIWDERIALPSFIQVRHYRHTVGTNSAETALQETRDYAISTIIGATVSRCANSTTHPGRSLAERVHDDKQFIA